MIRSIRILTRTGTAVLLAAFFLTAQADDTTSGLLKLSTELDEARGLCFDIAVFRDNIDLDVPMQAHTCKSNPNAQEDEIFQMNHPQPGNIHNAAYDVCVDVIAIVERGSVFVRPCSDSATQQFELTDDQELRPVGDSGLCVVVSPTPSYPAVRAGRTPEPGVTNVARAMSLAPCDEVEDALRLWQFPSGKE